MLQGSDTERDSWFQAQILHLLWELTPPLSSMVIWSEKYIDQILCGEVSPRFISNKK